MTGLKNLPLNRNEVLALRGLRLPSVALRSLKQAGIFCQPSVSIEYQQGPGRYLIRGVESGGATAEIGAYCGFVDESGSPLSVRQPILTIGVNGLHQAVLSPSLLRVQMFRAGNLVEVLLTCHSLLSTEDRARPRLQNSVLFQAKHGRIEPELWSKDRLLQGSVVPVFLSRSGDEMRVPEHFQDAVIRATVGVCCCGCRHSHLLDSGTALGSPVDNHPSSGDAR
jgi:hypothetical protein